jgi:hypothetical protein
MNDQKLETKTCGRCGGSGEYSFNQMHGSTCYGCGGQKIVFTKRGAAANAYLRDLRSKKGSDLKVGDSPQHEHFFKGARGFFKILEIKPITEENASQFWTDAETGERLFNKGGVRVTMVNSKLGELSVEYRADQMVRVAQTSEQKLETFKAALEYQSKLTKKGELMKKFQIAA